MANRREGDGAAIQQSMADGQSLPDK